MRHVVAAALAATCAVVALCPADQGEAGGQGRATTASALAGDSHGVHATLQRSRLFETQRALRLAVRSDGDRDVHVDAIQLTSPLFSPVAPQPRDPVVPAGGGSVAMPLQFGDARCDEAPDGPALVTIDAGGDQLVVPLDESPAGLLADLHADECAVAAVLDDAELRLGDDWERTAPRTVVGDVEVVQRRPGTTVTVAGLEGNVIFALGAADGSVPFAVSDDRPTAVAAVTLTAARCDPHALIEYKRTFTFVALVDVGADVPLRVDVEAEGDTRDLLQELLQACIG
jgi:hypothetical protein